MNHTHKNCLLCRQHLREYCLVYTPLSCDLPLRHDDYLAQISKSALYEYRKALKKGYVFEQVQQAPHPDMVEIMRSWQEKQHRKINLEYNTITFSNIAIKDRWPIDDYTTMQACSDHRLELFVVKKDKKTIAYAEVLQCDDIALIHATMAHKQYVGDGVMKLLFIEIARRNTGKKLLYGTTANLKDERKYFVQDLHITKPFTYMVKEPHQIIALDFDDLEIGKPGLDEIIQLKEHIPNLKVTFFMVPLASQLIQLQVKIPEYRAWAQWIKQQDWIEVCPHGVTHGGFEMKYLNSENGRMIDYDTANLYIDAAEKMFRELDLPFQKIWKSPHWETSPQAYQALWDRGYTVAVDPNQPVPRGGNIYVYNWSVEKPIPDFSMIRGHGHMYPPSQNAIQYVQLDLLNTLPEDAEYKFVSEIIL